MKFLVHETGQEKAIKIPVGLLNIQTRHLYVSTACIANVTFKVLTILLLLSQLVDSSRLQPFVKVLVTQASNF